jgi:hypothetical protein
MTGTADTPGRPDRKRRWRQFSLRGLLLFVTLVALLLSGIMWWRSARAQRMFWTVRACVPQVERLPARARAEQHLVGHFSDTAHVLGGGLSGSELYLFPDKTYLYLRWADILPMTIYDKGVWQYRDGLLALLSDGSIPVDARNHDREYLPLILPTNRRTASADPQSEMRLLLLLGSDWDFSYFRENVKEDPEFMLRLCTYGLEDSIPLEEANQLKDELIKECWRPDFFKE